MILDIFSRYVVGWTVQYRETVTLAERLIGETLAKQKIARDQLTIHADRGSSMTSKPVAFLLADLGITKTHSRPYTSTDNPYLRGAVHDAQVPPLSSPTNSTRSSTPVRFLPRVFPLRQRGAPGFRHRAHDPLSRPPRPGRGALRPARARP